MQLCKSSTIGASSCRMNVHMLESVLCLTAFTLQKIPPFMTRNVLDTDQRWIVSAQRSQECFYLAKAFSIQELCFFLSLTNCWKLRGTSWGGRSISQSCNVVGQEWFSILISKTSSEFIHLLKFIMNSGVYLAHIKSSLHSKQ